MNTESPHIPTSTPFAELKKDSVAIASELNRCLKKHNLTTVTAGNMIGVSRGAVSHWTAGDRNIGKKSIPAVKGFLGRYNWFGTAPHIDIAPYSVIISTGGPIDPYPYIPQELKDITRWLVWKSVNDPKTRKTKKIPVNAAGYPVSGKDPSNWMTYEQAIALSKNIGFQFSDKDFICGIDLDHCVDLHTGEIAEWASDIVFSFGTYSETSPSGTGLHIICKAEIDHTGVNQGNLEMYSKDRFFTFTGSKFDGDSIEDCTEEYKKLLAEHQEKKKPEEAQEITPVDMDKSEWTREDKNLFAKIAASNQGQAFQQLFAGKTTSYRSPSHADFALCSILVSWTEEDSKQIDRIFRASGLYRDKWDSKRGNSTYGAITIGKAIAYCKRDYQEPATSLQNNSKNSKPTINPAELLGGYEVSNEYVNGLGKERFIYDNLLIQQHVVTIISMSGSGKTTFFYFAVAPALAKKGLTVWYIDADSPASDHKKMKEAANKNGFKFLNPDANRGTSAEKLIAALKKIADAHQDMTDNVLIFDTLKKFADLMSKGSMKEFYKLARKLANLGATLVLLGHANKYRDKDGNLVFEGVGDVRSDSDELIQLESSKNSSGGIDVTTVVDSDKGAKVRGIFKPFSFNISTSREITFYDKPKNVVDRTISATPKATDSEIINATIEYLKTATEPVKQKQLADHVASMTGTGIRRIKQLIVQNADHKESPQGGDSPFVYTVGLKNAHLYELPKKDPVQTSIFSCAKKCGGSFGTTSITE